MRYRHAAALTLASLLSSSCALDPSDIDWIPGWNGHHGEHGGKDAAEPPSKSDAGRADDAGAEPEDDAALDDGAAQDTAVVEVDASLERCARSVPGAPLDDPFRRLRTSEDLPDDVPGEYQIHLLYVEPSDRAPSERLDESGAIRRSTSAWNEWLAEQTGGSRLRFDTCDGVLDVTHVKLPEPLTESALALGTGLEPGGAPWLRDRLELELKKTFRDPNKLYLVYYEGLSLGSCGGAPLPPSLAGHFPAVYLGGMFSTTPLVAAARAGDTQLTVFDPVQSGLPTGVFSAKLDAEEVVVLAVSGTTLTLSAPLAEPHAANALLVADTRPPDCRSNPLSRDGTSLGYLDYTAAHEVFHTLGVVSRAAPFHSTTAAPGHLNAASSGGTRDIMYQGAEPWSCGQSTDADATRASCVLDPAHENYWRPSGCSACVDLARSAFIDPKPSDAQTPPSW